MKKILIVAAVIFVAYLIVKPFSKGSDTEINGCTGTVESVKGNVLNLSSGLHVRLLGVEDGREEVEAFLQSQFVGKQVTIYADSHSSVQTIEDINDTISVYAVEVGKKTYCINRLVVMEYPNVYHEVEIPDSAAVDKWVKEGKLEIKKNLGLYMKQRTFLIQTTQGIGTGFFINEDGLAITNWHVLPPEEEETAIAVLYQNNSDDSQIYSDKKRHFKNIRWTQDISGLDITIVSVELENNEKVPYFELAKRHINQGEKVATFGNPNGLTASYSGGSLSAYRRDERGVMLAQYDIGTNGGNSGGPVCDDYGQVIAVHELGDKSLQNVNYGIDILQVREILDQLGLKYGGK